MTVTPVAPAAAIAPRAASSSATPSVRPGSTGARNTPHGRPASVIAADEVQPRPRRGHARLEGRVQVVVPDRHRDAEPDRDLLRGLGQQRDVAAEQRALGQDGERRAAIPSARG